MTRWKIVRCGDRFTLYLDGVAIRMSDCTVPLCATVLTTMMTKEEVSYEPAGPRT